MAIDNVNIIKASGETAVFDISKLEKSLLKSGASDHDINNILMEVSKILYDGMTTKEIYKKAYSYLKKKSAPNAARYKLKLAIQELGPTGYPFENLIGELFKVDGFRTEVGVIIRGRCVNHEVDVLAKKDKTHLLVECKYHNEPSRVTNVKVPLYINSRFIDIRNHIKDKNENTDIDYQGWIVTNTRFSEDALLYSKCVGLKLMSWDYPRNGSLKEKIDMSGLHPVTCLSTITQTEKLKILDKGKVLCLDLLGKENILHSIGISSPSRIKKIMAEAKGLCRVN